MHQEFTSDVKMLLIPGKIDKAYKVSNFFRLHDRRNSRRHFVKSGDILVPRGHPPFGQKQESRPLAWSNTGNPRFTDFSSLCACSESSLTNLIGSGLILLCLQRQSGRTGISLGRANGRDSWC